MSIPEVSNDDEELSTARGSQSARVETASEITPPVSDDIEGLSASGSAPAVATTEDVPIQAENIQPGAAPRPTQPTKTFFGLAQDSRRQGFPRPVFNDDYVERFPEDPYGQETVPNARIWRVYVEEAAAFDENMVGQSRDGLDVMLVFAGLFSAVVTSFLVQVSQNLQADFSEMSALLLHDLLIVQLSMADGATMNVTTPSVNPAQKFEPDAIDIWINGLWVVSLTASLAVALTAVLVKQWLHRYMTFPSGTPGLRSHVRQFRFMGLEKWRVRMVVGMLPIVMHISLMLFFAGLVLFYIPLRASLAWTVGTLTVLVCILYLVSNTVPIVYPQCPYQTPLTDFIHHVCQVVPFVIRSMRHYCFVAYRRIRKETVPSRQQSFAAAEDEFSPDRLQSNFISLAQLESNVVQGAHDTLPVDALDWLYQMSSNPTVRTLVLQGVSGLPAASHSYAVRKWSGARDMQTDRRRLLREGSQSHDFSVVERLCRSYLFLPRSNGDNHLREAALPMLSGDLGPRVVAAQSLILRESLFEPVYFFLNYSDLLIHPLLWEHIMDRLIKVLIGNPMYRSFFLHNFNECSFGQFLSLVVSPTLKTSPGASLMPATQVIWTRLEPQFWTTLLTVPLLAPHDSAVIAPISLYRRTLIAAGRLAISHVREHRNDMDHFTARCHHLDLLGRVVRLVTGTKFETWPTPVQWRVYLDFLFSVVELLGDVSFASTLAESPNDINIFRSCRHDVRSFYLWSSRSPEFHFPRLDVVLHTWANFDNSSRDFYMSSHFDADFTSTEMSDLTDAMDIIGNALSAGLEEAYRIFIDEDWMGIAFTEWAICGDSYTYVNIIESYIKGLHALTSISSRCNFCKYLHQPRQLVLAFMLILAAHPVYEDYPNRLQDLVVQLAKICPIHTSWKDCDAALTAILAWVQSPILETDLFPWPPSLQSLCTTATFPVVEATARHFSLRYKREHLEVALDTLHAVLENAEWVDGVMIPDLETKTDVDAVSPP